MTCQLRWLGHGSWEIQTGSHRVLLDPFLNDNPGCPVQAEQVEADFILVSHGHFDHVADVDSIARRTQATVVAIFEVAEWFKNKKNVPNTLGMNIGGGVDLPFGRVQMTAARHSSQLPDGSYGGEPAGFVLQVEGKRLYFACDTALFGDMQLIGRKGLDVAVLPIGDLFTMGPEDSVEATELLQPRHVLPAHYNTWPPIEQDADRWAQLVRQKTQAQPVVLSPGESFTV